MADIIFTKFYLTLIMTLVCLFINMNTRDKLVSVPTMAGVASGLGYMAWLVYTL